MLDERGEMWFDAVSQEQTWGTPPHSVFLYAALRRAGRVWEGTDFTTSDVEKCSSDFHVRMSPPGDSDSVGWLGSEVLCSEQVPSWCDPAAHGSFFQR